MGALDVLSPAYRQPPNITDEGPMARAFIRIDFQPEARGLQAIVFPPQPQALPAALAA
jgi:hypothetical protein